MKHILMLFVALLHLPVWGQPINRKTEIGTLTEKVCPVAEFRQVADFLQLSVRELCDYHVIFPIRKPQCISSGFGMRYHPIYRVRRFHTGIDISATKGTFVYAAGNGIVSRKGYNSGYGYYIEIQHAGGFRSFYAHLSRTLVNVGDSVVIATQIAFVGNTGIATGSHLHYEIRKGKRFLNPAGWCYLLYEMKIQAENIK